MKTMVWAFCCAQCCFRRALGHFLRRIICHIACDHSGLSLMTLEIPSSLVFYMNPVSIIVAVCMGIIFLALCLKFWLKYCPAQQHVHYT